MRKPGAYYVPLFLDKLSEEGNEKDIASLQFQHWRSMIARNPRGFRQSPGQSPKRKNPRNPRSGPLDMKLTGMQFVARHGSQAWASANV